MLNIILVAAGGAFGSVLRYLVGVVTLRWLGPGFPWGTLTVNIVGSFAIGLLTEAIARRFNASAELRLLLVTGVLGGFTTFSSFSLDTMALIERGAGVATIAYLAGSLGLSFLAIFAGLALGRAMF
jgi:CrcB protein